MRQLVNMRLPEELVRRVDAEAERLGQTRTKFVERALESALGGSSQEPQVPKAPSASSRAPVEKEPSGPSSATTRDQGETRPAPSRPAQDEIPLPKIALRRTR